MHEFKLIPNEIYQLLSNIGCYTDLDFNNPTILRKNDIIVFSQPTKIELAMLSEWVKKIKINSLIKPNIYPIIDIKKSQRLYIMDFFSDPEMIFVKLKTK